MAKLSILDRIKPVRLRDLSELSQISSMHASVIILRRCDRAPDGSAVPRRPLVYRLGQRPILLMRAQRVRTGLVKFEIIDFDTHQPLPAKIVECRPDALPTWFTISPLPAS